MQVFADSFMHMNILFSFMFSKLEHILFIQNMLKRLWNVASVYDGWDCCFKSLGFLNGARVAGVA